MFSEDSLLRMVCRYFPVQHSSLLLGRGDDCCVLKAGNPLCVSADMFLEDVHFRSRYFSPREVGHKALAVNISDVAACGVRPTAFTLCLALPPSVQTEWLEDFFAGMGALAKEHRMVLAGGDLSSADKIHISITVWGETTAGGKYLTRGGAMPGDAVFVIGELGLARAGLQVLEEQGRAALKEWPHACAAHLHPEPQVAAGLTLARITGGDRPPVLMDVSDGLARDLPRLLGLTGGAGRLELEDSIDLGGIDLGGIALGGRAAGAALGAEIVLPEGLLHPEVREHARARGLNPVREAWLGGEDYALLGACAPELLPPLHAALPHLHSIGTITDSGCIVCNNAPAPTHAGFDHFQN